MSPTVVKPRHKETPEDKKSRVLKIIGILDRTYPDTRLALNFTTPLELLIALILAAQCTDERVNQVTATLLRSTGLPRIGPASTGTRWRRRSAALAFTATRPNPSRNVAANS